MVKTKTTWLVGGKFIGEMKTVKRAQVPVRIDFAGGTTDLPYFAHKYGGATLNATINKYVSGKLVSTGHKTSLGYSGKIPTASGLGTSGAMDVLWLALIQKNKDREYLADATFKMQHARGVIGGKQDQYAAAFGGINLFEFKKDRVKRTPLKLNSEFIQELENNLVLVYTGLPHYESTANKSMIDNIKKGKHVKNLLRIKKIAYEMKKALLKKDLTKFSSLMNEETQNRKQLSSAVLPPGANKMIKLGLNNGASAAKICGSGSGGSILFFGDKKKLKKTFGRKVIDFKFDFDGLKIY